MNRWLQIPKIPELRHKILIILGLLVVYRILAAIPVPGVDVERIRNFTEGNQMFALFDIFSGGGFSNFSLVMLGVGPYITASIIMQLFTMIIPQLNTLYKEEGEAGRNKFNQYTRMVTVPLAIVQSLSMIALFRAQGIIVDLGVLETVGVISVMTAGTMFLMWIGEIITNLKIGNGVSLIIFAGIIAGLPSQLSVLYVNFDRADISLYLAYLLVVLAVVYAVVFITEGQRNIPISYSKGARGSFRSHVDTYLPLKVNQAGVIPIIFAVSLMVFPQMIAQFIVNAGLSWQWLVQGATVVNNLWANQIFYASAYFVLVLAFTFFYTNIVFEPDSIAENLQRQGGFITGIRPGKKTAEHLQYITNRIILFGAIFLGLIAVLPYIITGFTGQQNFAIGGTSLLIVVSVILETMKQIDAQITVRDYDSL